jgi:serine/threonine protein kinase
LAGTDLLAQPEICPRCGDCLEGGVSLGLCPRCLMMATIEQIDAADHPSLHGVSRLGHCPTIEQLNEQIGGLKFIELLGRGGSGWTFLAIQESLSREVAVKVICRRLSNDDETVARFRREAESLARLNHPGIVTVHDFGVTDEFLYLVMEYVAGPTLRERMLADAPNVPQSLQVVEQICAAVECAHDAGVLHRDLKPENILFVSYDADTQVKVADFGIAQLFTDDSTDDLTATGMIIGTPFYMAPEQCDHERRVDHRADVYSIGVIAYELLTGRLPLGRFPDPSSFVACNKTVDRAIGRALQNRPDDRMPDVASLARELDTTEESRRLPQVAAYLLLIATIGFGAWWLLAHQDAPGTAAVDNENPFLVALNQQTAAEPAASESSAVAAIPAKNADAQSDGDPSTAWPPAIGDRIKAKWGATWFDATVLKTIGEDHFLIHYEGWPDSHDEVLPLSQIRRPNWLE